MGDRPQRADARRNYERVLAAAREVFGELGVTAPLDEIARRAGVGNATMYRHFPTRRELVIAVYAGEVTALCELGRSLAADQSPGDWSVASDLPSSRNAVTSPAYTAITSSRRVGK